ncbi:MAG: Fe-S cluster assembly protein SufD [Anaerolineaceae bacterium]|nr:MAG: Fe-S cluster assembly protein SufD [Anaerolineaceae bacterium]
MSQSTIIRSRRKTQPKVTPEFPFTEADVLQASNRLGEPTWLVDRRLKAWERYQSLPMPTTKDEPWRRTDIRSLPADELVIKSAEATPVDSELSQPLVNGRDEWLLTIRPGHPPILEGTQKLEELGVVAVDWATAVREHEGILKDHLGKIVSDEDGKFSALTSAMVEYGVLLYVPPGIEIEQPLHSILWVPGTQAAYFSRLLLIIGEGSSVTYVHEAASPTSSDGASAHVGIVEIHLAKEAKFNFIEFQSLGRHIWNFTHERAHVGQQARLDWIYGGVGSHLTKNFTEFNLLAEGAEARMSAFYFADGVQHLDHDTQQNHLAPNTTSDLLFKGALLDRSRSVWQGMIYVAPGAQMTDGYQANRNLILNKNARADSIPGLEILADDVRCTHGATVGQLEEETIFYLMSRGLPRPVAERMMIEGFFASVIERVPFEGVQARFQGMIEDKLSKV